MSRLFGRDYSEHRRKWAERWRENLMSWSDRGGRFEMVREVLNQEIPYALIAAARRWWYILLIGPLGCLIFAFTTNVNLPFVTRTEVEINGVMVVVYPHVVWKEDVLFVVFGFLAACALVYVLEEIREFSQNRQP